MVGRLGSFVGHVLGFAVLAPSLVLVAPAQTASPGKYDDVTISVSESDSRVLEMMRSNEHVLETVFDTPFDPHVDGVLQLDSWPAAGGFVLCRREGEVCGLYAAEVDSYDDVLRRAGVPETTLAALSNEPRVAIVEGYLFSLKGVVSTSALVVTVAPVAAGAEPLFGALPLGYGDWPTLAMPADGCPCPSKDPNETSAEYATRVCGDEPGCNGSPEAPGIWECMRAARCRGDRCRWAECTTYAEENEDCPMWMGCGTIGTELVCGGAQLLETMGCIPGFIISGLK